MSRQFTLVHLPDYYKEKGVVFVKDYVPGIEMHSLQSRYTPTKGDILKAEKIFKDNYVKIRKIDVDIKEFFYCWVRQYVGLIDMNGNKNIVIQLVDNTKPRTINRLLGKNWETDFVVKLSDDFYKISTRFRINIETEEIFDKL